MPRSLFSTRPRRRSFVEQYLDQPVEYGGEVWTRAEVIRDMRSRGVANVLIDRWLQGADLRLERGLSLLDLPMPDRPLQ